MDGVMDMEGSTGGVTAESVWVGPLGEQVLAGVSRTLYTVTNSLYSHNYTPARGECGECVGWAIGRASLCRCVIVTV